MKKLSLKSKILLGAILMGGMAAGAHTISTIPNAADPKYDWVGTSEAPINPEEELEGRTVEEAQNFYGCAGEGEPCASGELATGTGLPSVTIHLN